MTTLGIDEVGRGPLAGPLVVGAVVLGNEIPQGLADSKKLSPKKRSELALKIKQTARGIGLGWVSAKTLDQIGVSEALKLATRRAVSQVKIDYNQVIIDGTIKLLDDPRAITMVKADARVKAVSAAAIIAKVARDEYMKKLSVIFPEYGFEKHAGYGTAAHLQAIKNHGASPVHRLSFAPFADKTKPPKIENTIGRQAENRAADLLRSQGHEVFHQNWKTKICEVDIISQKGTNLYFTEVKYRRNDQAGDGLEAITPKKLAQIKKSVEIYQKLNPHNFQPIISVISMSGTPPEVTKYLETIDT